MRGKRDLTDFLRDVILAAQKAIAFTDGMDYVSFAADEKTVYAVVRALEIVGEASGKIPRELRAKAPSIPWPIVTAMRDRIVHEYFGVDLEIVWSTIHDDLPPLIEAVSAMLSSYRPSED